METFITNSEQETKNLAKKISKERVRIIALVGELGSGKTTFVQGFAKGLGIKEKIISPTFVIIRQHKIPRSDYTLYHIDLYRLDKTGSLKNLGLEEILDDTKNIVLIEWAEKVKHILPNSTIWISFTALDNRTRKIKISP